MTIVLGGMMVVVFHTRAASVDSALVGFNLDYLKLADCRATPSNFFFPDFSDILANQASYESK